MACLNRKRISSTRRVRSSDRPPIGRTTYEAAVKVGPQLARDARSVSRVRHGEGRAVSKGSLRSIRSGLKPKERCSISPHVSWYGIQVYPRPVSSRHGPYNCLAKTEDCVVSFRDGRMPAARQRERNGSAEQSALDIWQQSLRGKSFLIWIRCNPLKSPHSDE